MIMLTADLENLTGDTALPAEGLILESGLDSKSGTYATCIIQNGTMRIGMFIASEGAIAPIRMIKNWKSENIDSATFSSPIRIVGWSAVPKIGNPFKTFATRDEAEEYSKIVAHVKTQETRSGGIS